MVCVPPDTDAETRVLVQIIYLGGEEIPCRKQGNETRKERQPVSCVLLSRTPWSKTSASSHWRTLETSAGCMP